MSVCWLALTRFFLHFHRRHPGRRAVASAFLPHPPGGRRTTRLLQSATASLRLRGQCRCQGVGLLALSAESTPLHCHALTLRATSVRNQPSGAGGCWCGTAARNLSKGLWRGRLTGHFARALYVVRPGKCARFGQSRSRLQLKAHAPRQSQRGANQFLHAAQSARPVGVPRSLAAHARPAAAARAVPAVNRYPILIPKAMQHLICSP
jgi:hypothetical protein